MSNLIEELAAYAVAFEHTYRDDDWQRLAQHFTPDAEREVLGGRGLAIHSVGREHVIADLRRNVADMDRRFDERIPEILVGPVERDGAVWMDWRLTLRRAGLPDLVVEGSHGTWHRDGAITRIEERVSDDVGARVEAYLERHAARLGPPSSEPTTDGRMRSLVESYARAKSRADAAGALALCTDAFTIDTVSFGIASRDRADTANQLAAFFQAFPDYGATVDGMAFAPGVATCWGTVRMTLQGPFLHLAPTNRTAEIPMFCAFTFADDRLASERFFFDLAQLCDGIGVPIDDVRGVLASLRAAAAA